MKWHIYIHVCACRNIKKIVYVEGPNVSHGAKQWYTPLDSIHPHAIISKLKDFSYLLFHSGVRELS